MSLKHVFLSVVSLCMVVGGKEWRTSFDHGYRTRVSVSLAKTTNDLQASTLTAGGALDLRSQVSKHGNVLLPGSPLDYGDRFSVSPWVKSGRDACVDGYLSANGEVVNRTWGYRGMGTQAGSRRLEAAGFQDTYRALHPDVRRNQALSWCAWAVNGAYYDYPLQARIDFIYLLGGKAVASHYVDSHQVQFPSDHGLFYTDIQVP